MKKFVVQVTQIIEVTLDETKFTTQFYDEFVESFFPYETLEDHAEHLAQLYARGVYDDTDFIEGYGPAKDMGIKFNYIGGDEEILS